MFEDYLDLIRGFFFGTEDDIDSDTILQLSYFVSALYTEYIAGVEGYPALLPCDVTPPHPDELVALVLWYRGDEGEPLYSYDSRQVHHTLRYLYLIHLF